MGGGGSSVYTWAVVYTLLTEPDYENCFLWLSNQPGISQGTPLEHSLL